MACKDYTWLIDALHHGMFRDAFLCPFQTTMGGTAFAAFVMLGVINMPIYIKQGSALGPFVLTLLIGGLVFTQIAALGQALLTVLILFVVGLGPILVLRRVQTG